MHAHGKSLQGAGELTNEVTLREADVMRFVDTDKAFFGKEATLAGGGELPWICAYLEIEPNGIEDGHGGEAVLLEGQVVGSTASVVFAHTVGKILAFAYVKPRAALAGTPLQVVIAGTPARRACWQNPHTTSQSHLPRN